MVIMKKRLPRLLWALFSVFSLTWLFFLFYYNMPPTDSVLSVLYYLILVMFMFAQVLLLKVPWRIFGPAWRRDSSVVARVHINDAPIWKGEDEYTHLLSFNNPQQRQRHQQRGHIMDIHV